ncbi:MAG: nucleotide sugar dehydrogenase [Saprospiraceae bacterium]|nr:nucleotide sugar dehydrogenase [Saprospiraceae bacterium]
MNPIEKLFCSVSTDIVSLYHLFNQAVQYQLPAGIALVVNSENILIGTITDGDIRRAIVQKNTLDLRAGDCMQSNPITFSEHATIGDILEALPGELTARGRKSNRFLSKIVLVDSLRRPVRVLDYHQLIEQRIAKHRNLVVVGLGYVGLTMALVLADEGFQVTGVEIDASRRAVLERGESYIHEIGLPELVKSHINKRFRTSENLPAEGDVYIISVGTPVEQGPDGEKIPVMKHLEDACRKIASHLKRGNLVILRSTVPMGASRNFVKPLLEKGSGLICGLDFHLSFAPERTAEGKALKELRSLPQIIGGYDPDSTEATAAIFRDVTPVIVRVDSMEAAEMAKLVNNSFRDYIFAFSNQMALIASKYNINVVDVIKAANEGYPRDPVPLPSPGVGGPCLTKDPHILASSGDKLGFTGDIFRKGRQINELMHHHVFNVVWNQLKTIGKNPEEAKILLCGMAFKGHPETGDIRNSSSIEIGMLFLNELKIVYAYDPIARPEEIASEGFIPVDIPSGFDRIDAVLFLNNHKIFEKINLYDMVRRMNDAPIIFDGWNLFRHENILTVKPCVYLGLSYVKSSLL